MSTFPHASGATLAGTFRQLGLGVRGLAAALCLIPFASQHAAMNDNATAAVTAGVDPPAMMRPVRVILVGDSTIATRTGYGDALCARFRPEVDCLNLARGGRSSKSFRAEGLWDAMLHRIAADRTSASPRATYVLIQFGHNDQPGKAERSTDLATEFPANMARYVDEVRAAGAAPVLVTPLTRRSFKGGVLQNDLRPWAEAILSIARERAVPVIDLNAKSNVVVAAMGSAEADTLAEEPPPKAPLPEGVKSRFDYTHLGEKGAALFSAMMATQITRAAPALGAYLRP